jgi:hypothetical protein
VAHSESDLLPDDVLVNLDEQLMYVVHRKDMKEWLERENDWPLSRDNLLSRWWPGKILESKVRPDVIPIPVPPGTEWKHVFISFLNEYTVQIKVAGSIERRSFHTLGFSDLRAAEPETRPSDVWGVLRQLARLNGEITFQDSTRTFEDPVKVKKWISQIRKKLKQVFPDIPGDPFHPYSKVKGYKTLFSLTTFPANM